eukprot:TRINITY_DN5753_c0_g1_i1.p1 TRINITY_DN5753_c0_g1~~TRINITY_DN5753_c0_g1_i1.p1  ORF type:complete len:137 (-),score=15.20 TRINITY_DN5753_c0_g1_i1:220-630(-)
MPLAFHPARASIVNLIYRKYPTLPGARDHRLPTKLHVFVTVATLYTCAVVGLVVGELNIVFGLVGATAFVIVSYILPSLMAMKISIAGMGFNPLNPGCLPEWIQFKLRLGRILLLVFGGIVFVVGAYDVFFPAKKS